MKVDRSVAFAPHSASVYRSERVLLTIPHDAHLNHGTVNKSAVVFRLLFRAHGIKDEVCHLPACTVVGVAGGDAQAGRVVTSNAAAPIRSERKISHGFCQFIPQHLTALNSDFRRFWIIFDWILSICMLNCSFCQFFAFIIFHCALFHITIQFIGHDNIQHAIAIFFTSECNRIPRSYPSRSMFYKIIKIRNRKYC